MKLKQFAYLAFGAVLTTYGTVSLISNYVDISLETNPQFANLAQNINAIKNFETISTPSLPSNNLVTGTRLPLDNKGNFVVEVKPNLQKIDLMLANHNGAFGLDSDLNEPNTLIKGVVNSDNLFPSILDVSELPNVAKLIIKDDVDFSKGYKNTYLHINPTYTIPLKLDILALKSEGILDLSQLKLDELVASLDNSSLFVTLSELNSTTNLTLSGNQNTISLRVPKNTKVEILSSKPDVIITNSTTPLPNSQSIVNLSLDNLNNSKVSISN